MYYTFVYDDLRCVILCATTNKELWTSTTENADIAETVWFLVLGIIIILFCGLYHSMVLSPGYIILFCVLYHSMVLSPSKIKIINQKVDTCIITGWYQLLVHNYWFIGILVKSYQCITFTTCYTRGGFF